MFHLFIYFVIYYLFYLFRPSVSFLVAVLQECAFVIFLVVDIHSVSGLRFKKELFDGLDSVCE